MTLIDYLVAFIPMLGILIFVHELGHFLVAKWCGVRVLKFSLGFGSPIGIGRYRLRWERGGTEYVIAWIPLGGFVKMLGENLQVQGEEPDPDAVPDAAPDEYLNAKPTWQKLAITFAGPAMNLLLPVVLYMGVLAVGMPRPLAVVGVVAPGSPAAQADLRPGDRIVAVDGEAVAWWEDVTQAIRARTQGSVRLDVERGPVETAARYELSVPVVQRSGLDQFGGSSPRGWIGLGHNRLPALLGVPSSDSPAARAGLRSGDLVLSAGGREVEDWEALRSVYAGLPEGPVALSVVRDDPEEPILLSVPKLAEIEALGVMPAAVFVQEAVADRPAARAGLLAGDLILAVDGRPVGSFSSFAETIRSSEGRTLQITYAREGQTETVGVAPELTVQNPLGIEGMEHEVYVIGVAHGEPLLRGAVGVEQLRNPLVALPRATQMAIDQTGAFLQGLGKLFTGGVSLKSVAGPIGIAKIARKTLDLGWITYIHTMIIISINLGILNLLPIPVLDGGQALIYMVEAVRRSPLSTRSREFVQSVGLTLLMLLMGLAFWNDLSPQWSKLVKWLSGGL